MVIVLFLGVLEKLIEMYQLWVVAGSSVLARNMTWLQPEEQHVHVGDVCDIAVEGLEWLYVNQIKCDIAEYLCGASSEESHIGIPATIAASRSTIDNFWLILSDK